MPQFHFHLIEPDSVIHDAEGFDLPDDIAAIGKAIEQVRGLLSCELRETGTLIIDRAIDIIDGDGRRVHTLRFPEAISMPRSPA